MQPFLSRDVSGRTAVWACAIMFAVCSLSAETGQPGKKGKGKGKRKGAVPTATTSPGEGGEQSRTNIPLPIGHDAKGLVLPDCDLPGRLRGKFVAGSARRIDQDHLPCQALTITTYTDAN